MHYSLAVVVYRVDICTEAQQNFDSLQRFGFGARFFKRRAGSKACSRHERGGVF